VTHFTLINFFFIFEEDLKPCNQNIYITVYVTYSANKYLNFEQRYLHWLLSA